MTRVSANAPSASRLPSAPTASVTYPANNGIYGGNWSGTVTVKEDHELIRTGPYGIVRHPIYTGLLFAILGSTVAFGEWRGLLAFGLLTIAFLFKLRREERFMSESFPNDYARYRVEVPALIPFIHIP